MYMAKSEPSTTRMATPSPEHCRRTVTQTAGTKTPVPTASSSRMRRKLTTEHGMTHRLTFALVWSTRVLCELITQFHSLLSVGLLCKSQTNAMLRSRSFQIGSSLEVYVITASQGPSTWQTNLSFILDGEVSYKALPVNSNKSTYQFSYNVPVYSISSLNNTYHTFAMKAMQGSSRSTLLFDYASYT